MKNITTLALSLAAALSFLSGNSSHAGEREDALCFAINQYLPGVSGFGVIAIDDVVINDSKKSVNIILNDVASHIPFTAESLAQLKADCRNTLGAKYAKYNISISAGTESLDKLVLFAKKKNNGPKEKDSFIIRHDKEKAPLGLDGANIALWQSHGWYFESKLNRWEWQRARLQQTVEDLYTQSYVMPFLMPMLENAGAYVMSPRERDTNLTEIIIDNDGALAHGKFSTEGTWSKSNKAAFAYTKKELHNGDHPFSDGTAVKTTTSGSDKSTCNAKWSANIPSDGTYAIYVSYTTEKNSSKSAHYRINAADGSHDFSINQRMGAGTWIYLGHFPLSAGNQTVVELFNDGKKGSVVSADAVKIGGGYGNVARIVKEPLDDIKYEYILSGYPRFTEGARYFLQWAGAPDSVFTSSDYVNDYDDDYKSRALWVNWLTGGSSMLPNREGLNIPVDLSFAFHSDAGTTPNDSIIGTLGIYCTNGDKLGNGSDRLASRDFTDLVMTNIVNDIRATYEPNWTRRGLRDASYFEARVPEVPTMLLELLSHQNFADMSYGLDPAFRFVVSRAVYKAMLKFIAQRDNRQYVIQPLPVHAFAITATNTNQYRLSWKERVDSLEETATPTYYIIEERIGAGAFKPIAKTNTAEYTVTVTDSDIHSYRIIAGNDGGTAFPSEILALCNQTGTPVTIVNGFTRVSAPERFDNGKTAGYKNWYDGGVPYINDISFIGDQYEFRREIPWMDDDASGFGASRANYEGKVIAGNTFDYTYTHGIAIAAAGHPFVSTSVEAFCESSEQPEIVDLILGKQKEIVQGRGVFGTRYKTFPKELQERIATLTTNGTSFLVSGAYVASDLWDNPLSCKEVAEADQAFATQILGYHWRVDQATVDGNAYQVQTRFSDFENGTYTFTQTPNAECYFVESPDSFYAFDKERGCTLMRYGENNLVAATVFDATTYRTVIIGFPFETITDAGQRSHLMKQVLNFFENPSPRNNIKR